MAQLTVGMLYMLTTSINNSGCLILSSTVLLFNNFTALLFFIAGQTDSQHINKSRTHLLPGTALPYVTSWFIRCKPQIVCSVLHWSSYSSDSPANRMSVSSDLFALAHAIFKSWPVGFPETSRRAAMVQCESHLILHIQIMFGLWKDWHI